MQFNPDKKWVDYVRDEQLRKIEGKLYDRFVERLKIEQKIKSRIRK